MKRAQVNPVEQTFEGVGALFNLRSKFIEHALHLRAVGAFYRDNHVFVGAEFVLCEPRDYDAETAIIGPAGGEIHVGEHRLIIPEGALQDWTLITMEAPPSLLVEVKFTPHGVHFDKQPQLKLSYTRCYVPHNHPFRVVYIDDANNILEWPTSVDLKHFGVVWAWIEHFSKYALASN